jgi:hypothetical protein
MEEFNTAQFEISSDDTLMVREGNYQYNIFNIIKRYGTVLRYSFRPSSKTAYATSSKPSTPI